MRSQTSSRGPSSPSRLFSQLLALAAVFLLSHFADANLNRVHAAEQVPSQSIQSTRESFRKINSSPAEDPLAAFIAALAPTGKQTADFTEAQAAIKAALTAAGIKTQNAASTAAPAATPTATPTDGPTQSSVQQLTQVSAGTLTHACAGPWTSEETTLENEMLRLVNIARSSPRSCGVNGYFPAVQPLAFNAKLRCAARKHSLDMGTRSYFSHDTLGSGQTPTSRMAAAGFRYNPGGENIVAGYTTAAEATNGLLNSDDHCVNIMSKGYNLMGVGCYHDVKPGNTYKYYWTQDFGSIRN